MIIMILLVMHKRYLLRYFLRIWKYIHISPKKIKTKNKRNIVINPLQWIDGKIGHLAIIIVTLLIIY